MRLPDRAKILKRSVEVTAGRGRRETFTRIQDAGEDVVQPCRVTSSDGAARRGKRLGTATDISHVVIVQRMATVAGTLARQDRLEIMDNLAGDTVFNLLEVRRIDRMRSLGRIHHLEILCREVR